MVLHYFTPDEYLVLIYRPPQSEKFHFVLKKYTCIVMELAFYGCIGASENIQCLFLSFTCPVESLFEATDILDIQIDTHT